MLQLTLVFFAPVSCALSRFSHALAFYSAREKEGDVGRLGVGDMVSRYYCAIPGALDRGCLVESCVMRLGIFARTRASPKLLALFSK